ncbi:MAG: flavodoxin [Proteobacteria bacterium]|nr:flavodoxin [Pseudomonadota bacterium]
MIFGLTGCSSPQTSNAQTPQNAAETAQSAAEQQPAPQAQNNAGADSDNQDAKTNTGSNQAQKSIVVYYSRTGENYSVGNITVGNTAKVAQEIAKQTGADMFEIKPVKPYPVEYKQCTEVAKQEKEDNARPQIATTVEHFEQYSTVYLGYPNWWGDMPMIVYTFIESQNFDGKTVIPFVTHEGSGLSGTPQKLRKVLPKATVTDGIAITGSTAQNKPDEVSKKVAELIKQAQN